MDFFSGLNQPLKRYLALLYGIILGLGLILAVLAIGMSWNGTPAAPASTKLAQVPTHAPASSTPGTQTAGKSTEIPSIPPTPNEVTPSTLGVTSADLHGQQVTVWLPWMGDSGEQLKSILEAYSQSNQWGIKVNVEGYAGFGSLDENVETAIISGTLPDLIIDYSSQAQLWDGDGIVVNLTPYVQDPLWGFTSIEQADFYPGFWAEDLANSPGADENRRLGIPYYRSAYVLFYNQSWAQELGFTSPPRSIEDFRSQACEAAVVRAAHNGGSETSKGGWLIRSLPGEAAGWIYAFGGSISNPNGPGYKFNNLGTRQAFTYLKDLVDQGCAWSDASLDPQAAFANREALFVVGSLFDIPAQQAAFTAAASNDQWVVIPFPSQNGAVVDTYGPSIMISRSTPARQLAAWLVAKWLVFPHNQIDWVTTLGVYPTRKSSTTFLMDTTGQNLEWNQALALLPAAHSEPSLASWSMVRWALNDALIELIDPKLTSDQIPALLQKLDNTASEIFSQVR